MKKFMFTAIAMVAFSSVSMGNTVTDENDKIFENLHNKIIFEQTQNPCKDAFSNALNAGYAMGMDNDGAWSFASTLYSMCQFHNAGI